MKQIFTGEVPPKLGDLFTYKMICSGKDGKIFFYKYYKYIVHVFTNLGDDSCPPTPDKSKYGNKYFWPIYVSFGIFMSDLDGKIVNQLTRTKSYDAKATILPNGKKMLFTSVRNAHLDLYIMDLKNEKIIQITNT